MIKKSLLACFSLCLILTACGDKKEVAHYKVPKPKPRSAAPAMGSGKKSGHDNHDGHDHGEHKHEAKPSVAPAAPVAAKTDFDWTAPSGWASAKNTSSMRMATFKVAAGDKTADVSIMRLGGNGGGVVGNVNRWRGQVGLADENAAAIQAGLQMEASGLGQFKYVKLTNGKSPDNGILASIFEQEGYVLFVKMTGPVSLLEIQETAFLNFCRSVRKK